MAFYRAAIGGGGGGGSQATAGTVSIPVGSEVEIDTGLTTINQFVLFGYRNTNMMDSAYFCAAVYNKDASTTQAIAVYQGSNITYRNISPSAYVTYGNVISSVSGGKVRVMGIRNTSANPNNYHWFAC